MPARATSTQALEFQRRADAILETQMGLYLASGSERQKLAFVRAEAERTDRTISLHLRQARDNPDAASLAALGDPAAQGTGAGRDGGPVRAVRRRVSSPGDRGLMDQLKMTTARLARIALTVPAPAPRTGARHSRGSSHARSSWRPRSARAARRSEPRSGR